MSSFFHLISVRCHAQNTVFVNSEYIVKEHDHTL